MEEGAASDGVPGHEVGASPGVPGHAVSIEKRGASAGGPRLARMRGVSLRSPWHGGITEGGAASDGVPGHERDERGGAAAGVPGHAVSIEKRGASAGGPRLARMRGVSL